MDSMDRHQVIESGTSPFLDALNRLPELMDKNDVLQMIDVQVATLDRLECTNKSLVNCSNMAQSRLAATTKLYKKTAKQLAESKKDLDVCYKKILDLKTRIKSERSNLSSPPKELEATPLGDNIDAE